MTAPGEFGGDEQLVARHTAAPYGGTNGTFVFVVEGRVQQAIPETDRLDDGVGPGGAIQGIRAEADRRQGESRTTINGGDCHDCFPFEGGPDEDSG